MDRQKLISVLWSSWLTRVRPGEIFNQSEATFLILANQVYHGLPGVPGQGVAGGGERAAARQNSGGVIVSVQSRSGLSS